MTSDHCCSSCSSSMIRPRSAFKTIVTGFSSASACSHSFQTCMPSDSEDDVSVLLPLSPQASPQDGSTATLCTGLVTYCMLSETKRLTGDQEPRRNAFSDMESSESHLSLSFGGIMGAGRSGYGLIGLGSGG